MGGQSEQSRTAPESPRPLVAYYDQLANRYDADRFGNSYGRYLHGQEHRLLKHWLAPRQGQPILDLACGTGRLLDLATHGLDASEAMVRLAHQKHPKKTVRVGLAANPAEFGVQFAAIFCVHLLMHLAKPEIARVLRVAFDQLQPGGVLIFDVPSGHRRALSGFQPTGWHAGTAFDWREVLAMTEAKWRLCRTRGVLFFPIHRLPALIRPALRPFDDLVGATPLKRWSSYQFFCLERRP
jgi:SAM-dependent methyltransferase